ncbi:MAG: hypothetical protein IH609_10450 [Dehalococcoidia bacterium]|nr:hypothetical protein [Dehalococcoidia bacterium]
MLRPGQQPWWRKIFAESTVVSTADAVARRCPDCSSAYDSRDRYCPHCHAATPEWRYG